MKDASEPMRPIPIELPATARAVGEILTDYEGVAERLSQDILQVTLSTGVTIDVGWEPRFDPDGHFLITVFRGEWDDQLILPLETDNPFQAAEWVRQIACLLDFLEGNA